MAHPKILVTGATGKTGMAVVAELLARDVPVRAVVRSRDARSERLHRAGAEVVAVDLLDPDAIVEAMRGTQRAYFLPPFDPSMLDAAKHFAAAAVATRTESIVGLSQWLASPHHPAWLTRQLWSMDELFGYWPESLTRSSIRPSSPIIICG